MNEYLKYLLLFSGLFAFWSCTLNKKNTVQTPLKIKKETSSYQTSVEEMPTKAVSYTPDPYSTLIELETSKGKMKIELFCDAPIHKENFQKLIQEAFYDSLLFHRVISGFMIQGGDPNSKTAKTGAFLGSGRNNYELNAEISSRFVHLKGALAAARTPDEQNPLKKSSGCQFYIVHGRNVYDQELDQLERKYNIVYTSEQRAWYKKHGGTPHLDMEYSVFGRVYEGLEVIDSIANMPVDKYSRPKENMRMSFKIIKE